MTSIHLRRLLEAAAGLASVLVVAGCGRSNLGGESDAEVPDSIVPVDCERDADCDDGNPCNGVEQCLEGACAPGAPVVCDDGVDCTADTCNPETGGCEILPDHTRCGRNMLCDPALGCIGRPCDGSEECDDGYFCNGVEYCESGYCQPGAPHVCDDAIACTVDVCDEVVDGCSHDADDAVCDNGLACDGEESCDPLVGCRPGQPPRCDDSDPCTSDRCDEEMGCVFEPRDGDRDGYADCACAEAPCDCDDSDITVNPGMTEQCRDLRDNDCDDRADCDDSDCLWHPRCGGEGCTEDEDCDNGLYCDGEERCDGRRCVGGEPIDCGDSIRCTVDACNEESDTCGHTPDHSRCAPGELCDPAVGCVRRPCASDTECDNGLYCDGAEVCSSAGTCTGGPPPACADDVDCTEDRCDEATDSCSSVPNDWLCNNGRWCDGEEACDPDSGCVEGEAPCGESTECETVRCRERRRECEVTIRDDDGDGFPPEACGGGDCDDLDWSVNPGAEEVCGDLVDNDCDRLVDCDDDSCAGSPECCIPTGPEACGDRVDNDCDGWTDCSDVVDCGLAPECGGCVPEICWDGLDNDCDDLVDCGDSDCDWYPPCEGPDFETNCSNGLDDDLDGATDCDDPDCESDPFCPWPDDCTTAADITGLSAVTGSTAMLSDDYSPDTGFPGCAGGRGPEAVYYLVIDVTSAVHLDTIGSDYDTVLYVRRDHCASGAQVACNDDAEWLQSVVDFVAEPGYYFIFVDGYGDWSLGRYRLSISVVPLGTEVCDNFEDDDGDGLVDCEDDDCFGSPSCELEPERGPDLCSDGEDNDGDGLADCDDAEDCAVVDFVAECCNGEDDNGNGVVDEFSCACDETAPCDRGVCYAETIGACGPGCSRLGGDTFCGWVFPGTYCSAWTDTCVY